MQRQNVRVLVASEYPEVRRFLSEIAIREPEAVVVGQAENGIKAITQARNLRPDVAILDCHLPYTAAFDTVPLSRAGGLDAARTISQEVPTTRVIVLGNLDVELFRELGLRPALEAYLSRQTAGASVPLTLWEVPDTGSQESAVVFANVETREPRARRQGVFGISDAAIMFGGLAILVGLALTSTMILIPVGAPLGLVGGVALFFGVAGKLISNLWPRHSRD